MRAVRTCSTSGIPRRASDFSMLAASGSTTPGLNSTRTSTLAVSFGSVTSAGGRFVLGRPNDTDVRGRETLAAPDAGGSHTRPHETPRREATLAEISPRKEEDRPGE